MALRKPETTHSRFFVRTSASLLADSGASIDVWKRHGGWKSASVAEGYIENSINTKKIVADSIFGLGVGNSTESASAHQVSGSAVSASSASSTSRLRKILIGHQSEIQFRTFSLVQWLRLSNYYLDLNMQSHLRDHDSSLVGSSLDPASQVSHTRGPKGQYPSRVDMEKRGMEIRPMAKSATASEKRK
ncbi:hypothetical protein NQ315_010521 [Exocentrus adspersus]|uniref:Uncharacterized protein n=1 Tax=Exocentrus adspersus TaxID=1586481 RepID=A0AAV8W5K9_9CUCU|nr:hypothetical protein NQ315_010521 [Exocentrus adspersus]